MSNYPLTHGEILVEVMPNVTVAVTPYRTDDTVFLNLEIATPFGPVKSIFSADTETFNRMVRAAAEHNVPLRLSSFMHRTFGQRPIISRRLPPGR
jgi:hypothetical protein